ncbi:DedA family protein [Nesterenkonia flava]|uniref:DedA family protein n=1 Tax=Nesterenkonia flava TaxID=469799 RepID=A0ABU1FY08_9MICC|nr:DedA family protein [Nesterenkonia flava]MDR5713043.1 DedA family protein [Nesterenkonia flava]
MGLGELIDGLNELILNAASGWWTLVGLFAFCVADGFFPILPSDALVVGLGSLQGEPGTPFWLWSALVAAAGALIGDFIAYHLGRGLGSGMLEGRGRFRWMRRPGTLKTLLWARHELDKRGVLVIFVGRFIPGGRVAINFVAGSTRYSLRRFLLIDAFASLVWAGWLTGLGIAGTAIFGNMLIAMAVGIGVAVVLGWIFDRLFRILTRWLDSRGVHLDPEDYKDTSTIEIDPPIHLRRKRDDG